MLPTGIVAVVLLLSLVPGWIFLRVSEPARRPRNQSELQEVLELVAVGVGTTGLALTLAVLFRSDGVYALHPRPRSAEDLHEIALSVVLVLLLATAIALAIGALVRWTSTRTQGKLGTSVWWDILKPESVPPGKLPYLQVTLNDEKGTTVEGVLASYTWQSDSTHNRDLALKAPIRYPDGTNTDGKSVSRRPGYDFVIIAGGDIRQVAIKHVPVGKAEKPRRGKGTPGSPIAPHGGIRAKP